MIRSAKPINGGLSNIRLVTSDWSGVHSDDRKPVYEVNMRFLEAHGQQRYPLEQWLRNTKYNLPAFLRSHGIIMDEAETLKEYGRLLTVVKASGLAPVPYSDSRRVLAHISRWIPVVVVSGHPLAHLRNEAMGYGIPNRVELEGGAKSVEEKAEKILGACKRRGVDPADTVYIGDSVTDIQSGKRAGVVTFGITTGYHSGERLWGEAPDFLVDSLGEFLRVLERSIMTAKIAMQRNRG